MPATRSTWAPPASFLQQIPSGILHPGVRCAIGNGVVLDPETLFTEIERLVKGGVDVEGRLYRSAIGRTWCSRITSCSTARARRAGRSARPAAGSVRPTRTRSRGAASGCSTCGIPRTWRGWSSAAVDHANALLAHFGSAKRANVEETLPTLEALAPRLLALADDVGLACIGRSRRGAAVLLEGAQGSLLDVDHGTYPFVTSSNTTSGGAAVGVGIAPTAIDAVLGVVKAYTTRVGNGPLPTEFDEPLASAMRELGHEYGAVTGRPRRCGWFDAVVVRYAARINGLSGLAVTKLDVLDTLDRVGDLHRVRDRRRRAHTNFPGDLAALEHMRSRATSGSMGGEQSTAGMRRLEDLPSRGAAYLDRIESLVEAPIRFVSVGTRRDQIIRSRARSAQRRDAAMGPAGHASGSDVGS